MNDIINTIQSANHVVVIAHKNPDADSLGSASAMYTHLLMLHKKVSFFCATKNINQKLSFLPWFDKIRDSFPDSADLAIALDCGAENRMGIDNLTCDLINIDHHEGNTSYGAFNLVDATSISTTFLLYNFFIKNNISINKKMATALYAGLLDDSNGFLSEQVDATVFATSRALIELGADYKLCNNYIMKYQTLAGLRLKAIMFKNMKLLSDAKVALFLVSDEDMKQSGAIGEECEGALEEALYLPTVEVSVLIKENADFTLKVSIRSAETFNALDLAVQFSGGGHRSRSGFNLEAEYSLKRASEEILHLINKEI